MTAQPPPRRRPFQFRLRTLFILTAVVAIVLSGLFAPSDYVRVMSANTVRLAIPVSLTTLLVYGRGYVRTFCIGGLLPSAGIVLSAPYYANWPGLDVFAGGEPTPAPVLVSEQEATIALAWLVLGLVLTIAMGLLAMGVRWLVESGNRVNTQ